jgi:cytochrome P450
VNRLTIGVSEFPAHVPPALVWNQSYDAFTAQGHDPFVAVARLHQGPPLIWARDAAYGRPGWIATRFDLIAEVLMDHTCFSGERKGMIAELVGEPVRLNPIEIDPPAHHGYRRNLNPQFTPKAVAGLEQAVRRTAEILIDRFAAAGRCDFIRDFAIPFPTHVFLDLLALPHDRAGEFLKWEEDLMRAPDPADRVAAARAIYVHLKAHKDAQLANPANALNAAITQGEFAGRPLNHLEMMGMYYVLWVGGLDTVYSTLGWIMHHLATHPDDQTCLRANPERIPAAVEEFVRAFSVVTTHREITRDCTLQGITLKQGEEIHLPLSLANRDPSAFPDPHRIDLDRQPRHIAFGFGFGPHNCLGVHLAKRELRIVIELFLKRYSAIRLAPGHPCRHHTGRTFGMDYLPLELDG